MKLISRLEYDYKIYLNNWKFPGQSKATLNELKIISKRYKNPSGQIYGYGPYDFKEFKEKYQEIKKILYLYYEKEPI